MGIALVVAGAHAHSPRWPADYCYNDNVLRELENPKHSASAFCSSFLATTSVLLPTYLTQYSTTTERVSSACSCFFKTTATNPTSTTSISSTSGTSPSKSSSTTPGSPTCTGGATVTVTDATTATITQTNTVSSCTLSSCTASATEGTVTVTNTVSSCTATTAGTTVTITDTVTAVSTATSTCPTASTVTVTYTVTSPLTTTVTFPVVSTVTVPYTVTSPLTATVTFPVVSTVTVTDVTTITAPTSTCPSPSTLTITTTNSPSTCIPTTASVTVTQPCTSSTAACVLGKEDLVNGGFENGLAPWTLQTALPNVGLTSVTTPSDPTVAHSGSRYLRLDFLNDQTSSATGSNALITQSITLPSVNSWYRVTGYAKSDTPISRFSICIDVDQCNTAFLNTVWTPISFTVLSSTEVADLQVVVRLEFFTGSDAPVGTSYVEVDDLDVHCTDSDVGL